MVIVLSNNRVYCGTLNDKEYQELIKRLPKSKIICLKESDDNRIIQIYNDSTLIRRQIWNIRGCSSE